MASVLTAGKRSVFAGLTAAHILLAAIAAQVATTGNPVAAFCASGLWNAQMGLIGFWGAIGVGSNVVRLSCMAVGLAYLWTLRGAIIRRWLIGDMLILVVPVILVYSVAHVMKYRSFVRRQLIQCLQLTYRPHIQFTLHSVFLLVTVLAIVLGVIHFAIVNPHDAAYLGPLCVKMSVAGALSAWSVFGGGQWIVRVVVIVSLMMWEGAYHIAMSGASIITGWHYNVIMASTQTIVLVLSLCILRLSGCRLR